MMAKRAERLDAEPDLLVLGFAGESRRRGTGKRRVPAPGSATVLSAFMLLTQCHWPDRSIVRSAHGTAHEHETGHQARAFVDDFQSVRTGPPLRGDVEPERVDAAAGPAGLPIEIDRILAQEAVPAAVVHVAPHGQFQNAVFLPARWEDEVLAVERARAGRLFGVVPAGSSSSASSRPTRRPAAAASGPAPRSRRAPCRQLWFRSRWR